MTNGKEILSKYMKGFSELPQTSIKPGSDFVKLAEKLPPQTYTIGGTIEQKLGKTPTSGETPGGTTPIDITQSKIVTDLGMGLPTWYYNRMLDYWSLFTGTAESKTQTLSEWVPTTDIAKLGFKTIGTDILQKEYGTGGLVVNPLDPDKPTKIPDIIGGIGNKLLIGAAIIGGIYILGKYIGRKK